MQKSPDAFRTISEVADDLSIPAHVLRFWETKFHQISPVKRGGGRRYYRPDDVRLLRGLQQLLHGDGLTIIGAQKLLRERGIRHVVDLGDEAPQPETRPAPGPATNGAGAVTKASPPQVAPSATPPAPAGDLAQIYGQLRALRDRVALAADRDIDSL